MTVRAVLASCLLLLVAVTPGCGGGGGGGGGGGKPGGGNGAFKVTAGPGGGKIAGLNFPLTLQFNKDVAASSVNASTVQIVTVDDPAGQATAPGGIQASVTFAINSKTVTISPTVEFAPDKVTYGFQADALYEIAFTNPNNGISVQDTSGDALSNWQTSFFFRTPTAGFDFNPGYPHARAFIVPNPGSAVIPAEIVDANLDGSVVDDAIALFPGATEVLQTNPLLQVGVKPTEPILFFFDDAVQPQSVINPVDGSSPCINISINTEPLPEFLPKTLTAQYTFVHQQDNLSILQWTPEFVAYPPGGFLLVKVGATAEDLAGNSKASLTESGGDDLAAALAVAGVPDPAVYSVFEPFSTQDFEDGAATSGEWNSKFPGLLGPVLGGGTGKDGPFIVDLNGTATDPAKTVLPPAAVVDFTQRTVQLPSVEQVADGVFEPRDWEFSSFSLPQGWTLRILTDANGDGLPDPEAYVVQSPGHPLDGLGAPLVIRCSGNVDVFGTIDVRGSDAATCVRPEGPFDPAYAAYLGQGGVGAQSTSASGAGGDGGAVLMLQTGGTVAFNLISPPASPAFQTADPKLRGVTGRSTGLTATVLHDANSFLNLLDNDPLTPAVGDPLLTAAIDAGTLLLQPNVGVGSSLAGNSGTANQSIDENHDTFVITKVSVGASGTDITVSSAPGAPTMTEPSDNIGAAPIAAAGDCYLVGLLRGHDGLDVTPLARGGVGAQPYVVVDEGALGLSTTGGGGGGGGAVAPGSAGLSDGPPSNPLVDQRGTSGGIALDESPGAAGGIGAVRGTGQVLDGTHIALVTQTSGEPLTGLSGAALVGGTLVPDTPNSGWMFEVAAFDGATFTVHPIQLDALDIGLLDGPGFDGPGLQVGHVYEFLTVPSLDFGGSGGGGSGVSVTGTVNNANNVLPVFAPGASGGSGGGSLTLESAAKMTLGATAQITAQGGKGGAVFDLQTLFAGGGGGGGGNIVLRAGKELESFLGAVVNVKGGDGGSVPGTGQGGAGGAGYVRVENFDDTLTPALVESITQPPAAPENLGRQLGLPQGVGQSTFYQATVVNPEWKTVKVDYLADTNGDDVPEACSWSFDEHGAAGGPQGFLDPPVTVSFNTNGTDDDGFFDGVNIDSAFYPASDLVSARTGLAWDSAGLALLYARGEDCTQVDRLDPVTLLPVASGPQSIALPLIPAAGSSKINIVSLAVSALPHEVFVLERSTHRVHVIDPDTGGFLRTISLPMDLQGAMTYDPTSDLLLFADDAGARIVTFHPRDPAAGGAAATTDYAPNLPVSQFQCSRDGVTLATHLVGLAVDAATPALWCSDAQSRTLFRVSLAAATKGQSLSGLDGFSVLTSGGQGVIPSGLAFDGTSLFLIHATDPADSRVQALPPSAVSVTGADLNLAGFGTLLPEKPRAIGDGDIFLRFRVVIDGVHDAVGTSFRQVRVDEVTFTYSNSSF
jgi:hypothetical protein